MGKNLDNIPGFFYDRERKAYFRIQPGASLNDAYSEASVRIRRTKERLGDERRQQEARRSRRDWLRINPLSLASLQRETGLGHGHVGADTGTAGWAAGLTAKGRVSMWPPYEEVGAMAKALPDIESFYVIGGDTKTGPGVVYAATDHGDMVVDQDRGAVPPDESGISRRLIRRDGNKNVLYGRQTMNQYRFDTASRVCRSSARVTALKPAPTTHPQVFRRSFRLDCCTRVGAYDLAFNPSRSSAGRALIATSQGLIEFNCGASGNGRMHKMDGDEMLAVDYLGQQHGDVALAGGRSGRVYLVDTRQPTRQWDWLLHDAPAVRLRSLGQHEVLVAGVGDKMAMYDIRHRRTAALSGLARGRQAKRQRVEATADHGATVPLVRFPEYRNDGLLRFGFDVCTEYGVVACGLGSAWDAEVQKGVGLFSLRTGLRLRAPGLDRVRAKHAVRGLAFQTLPGDDHPSVFVGVGGEIEVLTFGTEQDAQGVDVEE
ncbi:hypothetical protein P8C59_004320 [Phyllachora maydis]|uniref:Uncharacterized protein n=1 Tax=Phyllachora maydis TaxID=1825666 RepID=A0AAD9ME97_9PEZI|nr:hypothetical protein P8C59_004320 [Phyllachora maydis]